MIVSAKKFPVILPMIALNISYYLKELNESSIVFIEFLCKMLIKHYLDNHYKYPFSIEKVISSDYFSFSKSDFYWIIGYNKEKEILYYFEDNSIYSNNIASFDIKKDSLEKLEGYPYNIINQGEPLLQEKVLKKKSIK